jgi:hypothetical protein
MAENGKDISETSYKDMGSGETNYIVTNWGNYGSLMPEVSSLNFSSKYWNGFTGIPELETKNRN